MTACISWAMPMVATSTITRGEVNSRRITARSTRAPTRVPMSIAVASAIQNGHL